MPVTCIDRILHLLQLRLQQQSQRRWPLQQPTNSKQHQSLRTGLVNHQVHLPTYISMIFQQSTAPVKHHSNIYRKEFRHDHTFHIPHTIHKTQGSQHYIPNTPLRMTPPIQHRPQTLHTVYRNSQQRASQKSSTKNSICKDASAERGC